MTTNVAASVKARLNNRAKKGGKPTDYYYLHYGIERFLYRLSQSEYASKFILKGGLAFLMIDDSFPRPTRDIDLLGYADNNIPALVAMVKNICQVPIEQDDGLRFDLESIKGEIIQEQKEYHGSRIKFDAYLERSQIRIQIDFAFDDEVYPEPQYLPYPVLLDGQPHPSIRVYPPETILAEKIHAIVFLELTNDRIKDFYDIWYLSEYP